MYSQASASLEQVQQMYKFYVHTCIHAAGVLLMAAKTVRCQPTETCSESRRCAHATVNTVQWVLLFGSRTRAHRHSFRARI